MIYLAITIKLAKSRLICVNHLIFAQPVKMCDYQFAIYPGFNFEREVRGSWGWKGKGDKYNGLIPRESYRGVGDGKAKVIWKEKEEGKLRKGSK